MRIPLPIPDRARRAARILALPALLLLVIPWMAGPAQGQSAGEAWRALSPDGRIAFELSLDGEGRPHYRVLTDGVPVVNPSRLGFLLADAPPLNRGFRVAGARTRDGLDLHRLENRYGLVLLPSNGKLIERWIDEGLLEQWNQCLRPTIRGMAVAEGLAASLELG